LDARRGAFGVHDVVNENMAGAARVAIAERGRVPQEYALLATGGAGPVHAWNVGRKLGVRHVVCPPCAGAGSTIGMLMAPARIDRVASFNQALQDADWDAAIAIFAELEREAWSVATATGADLDQRAVRRLADMRYVGQGSEITVALPATLDATTVRTAFEASYLALFGRAPPGAAIQFVALRLALTAPMPGAGNMLRLGRAAPAVDLATALKGRRDVYFSDAGGTETPVYDRYALPAGTRIVGPAVFEENESTFVIGPSSSATVLPDGSILTEMPNDGAA
jgi:N-methylhydantoinase A